jgi:hypothetical protein
MAMAETKYERITSRARRRVMAGTDPGSAWQETLQELYRDEALTNQVKHSCPKWAFCILCHRGHVRGVRRGCCPAAEESSSAAYTLTAFELLRADPSLAANKGKLKRRVFGEKGAEGYRTPNDEVEVLLALRKADTLAGCAVAR